MDNENDNMETIIYQGQQVAVEPMGEMGGYMGKLRGQGRNGEDQLFRDEAGRYYLRQKRFVENGDIQFMHQAEDAGMLFERVHAINVNAAILWAISFMGSDGWKLRCDAADLLMEGRGYQDPHPSHLSVEQRAMVSDPDRFASGARTLEPTAAAGDGRTVRLLCPDGSVFADVDCEPDIAVGVQAIADEKKLDFGNAFLGLLRDFFARDGKEAV